LRERRVLIRRERRGRLENDNVVLLDRHAVHVRQQRRLHRRAINRKQWMHQP